jgi:biopolymer transport protein ExbD
MTPMIDVIFLLTVFFLCVNQFQKAETDERVQLPTASRENVEPARPAGPKRVILNVRHGEGVVVGGRTLQDAEIAPFLSEQVQESGGDLQVWIRSDRRAPFARIEPILLACADAGIWDVAFKVVTQREPGGN